MAGRDRDRGPDDYEWLYGDGRRQESEDDWTRMLPTDRASEDHTRQFPAQSAQPGPDPTPAPTPPGSPPRSSSPPRRHRPRRWRRVVLTLLLLWLAFLVAVPVWAWTQVQQVDAMPATARPPEQPGTTYLLVGSDSREELSAEQRSNLGTGTAAGRRADTIMLLHTGDGPPLLMSIPRDSLVEVPGYGVTKINAAFAYGGPELLTHTLEQATGIRIDEYIQIGLGGFAGIVNALGGIRICPEEPLHDEHAALDIPAGCQEVDGETALGFVRSRKTQQLGDIGRAANQRQVLAAIGDKALSPWTVLNPVRYVRLADAASEALVVGEETGPVALGRFAVAMMRVDGESGLMCGVPIADLAVHWDSERAPRLFSYIINDDTESIPDSLCTTSGLPQ